MEIEDGAGLPYMQELLYSIKIFFFFFLFVLFLLI